MTTKRISMLLSALCLLVLAFSVPPMLLGDDDDGDHTYWNTGCKLQGAWFTGMQPGFGGWMLTFNGTGNKKGTTDWEFPLEDDPLYPDGTWTIGRGIWVNSGPNIYDYTFQAYFLDDSGVLVYIALNKGTLTLTDCNTAEIEGTVSFYDPDGFIVWWCPDSGVPYGPMLVRKLILNQEDPIL